MDVTVEIDLPARTNVLMVPDGALTFAPQGQRAGTNVYLLGSDNQPRQIPVAVEASDGKRTEVVANGLEPGAQVITGWRHSPGVQSAEVLRAGNLDRAPRVTWMMRLMKKPTAPVVAQIFAP
jgi:HlyD family secretion protein